MKMEHRTTTLHGHVTRMVRTVQINFRARSIGICNRTSVWTRNNICQTVTGRRARAASYVRSFLLRVTEFAHVVSACVWAPDKNVQLSSRER